MTEQEDMPYAELQRWMQEMIMPQNRRPEGLTQVNKIINPSERLSAQRHLDIYQGSYVARLRDCMRNQFPTLEYALGKELFEAFTDQYLGAYPPTSYTLNELGSRFASFLEETRPDAEEEIKEDWPDFMIALAKFEFSISQIFDEQADENLTEANEATPDEQLRLRPVFHLFQHSYPICHYYLEHAYNKEPELPYPSESHCVVLRQHYKLALFVIKPAQYYFLNCLQAGASIAEAMDDMGARFAFTATEITSLWKEWRRHFIVSGFFLDG